MKRIVIIILFTLSFVSAYSQEYEPKNVLRGGTSLVFFGRNNYKDKFELNIGNQIALEYSRKFSSIYSLDVSLFKQNFHGSYLYKYSDCNEPRFFKHNSTGVSIRNIFSPFNKARWIRFGIGAFAEYNIGQKSNDDVWYYQTKGMFYSVSLPIRLYILDAKRFDLYAYYEFVATIDYSNSSYKEDCRHFYQPYNLCGVMFGVKF